MAPPFVLAERVANTLVVTAVDPRGLADGIFKGQRLADARACLPGITVAPARPQADAKGLLGLARWCSRYGPLTNCQGPDGIWIDISGVAHLFGGEAALLETIGSGLGGFGFTAQVGLADTPGAAWALARYGAAPAAAGKCSHIIAPPKRTSEAIASLPVEALRLDHATVLLLRRLGLKRIDQLQVVPRASLKQRFTSRRIAEAVLERLDQAVGRLAEPLKPLVPEPVHEVRLAFAEPLITHDGLIACLSHLACDLCGQLEKCRVGLRQAELRVFRADGSMTRLGIGTGRPCRQPGHLIRLFGEKIANVDAGFGIDLVVLAALSVDAMEDVQTAFAAEGSATGSRQAGLASGLASGGAVADLVGDLIDRLSNRLGAHRVVRICAHQSHLPEQAQCVMPAIARLRRRLQAGRGIAVNNFHPVGMLQLHARPLLMLARPERIDVLAEVPEGAPQRFRWRRVLRRVMRAEGPERIEPEWWRDLYHSDFSGPGQIDDEAGRLVASQAGHKGGPQSDGRHGSAPLTVNRSAFPRTRDYYRVEDDGGARYWIFRDGLYQGQSWRDGETGSGVAHGAPSWFLHGLFA